MVNLDGMQRLCLGDSFCEDREPGISEDALPEPVLDKEI